MRRIFSILIILLLCGLLIGGFIAIKDIKNSGVTITKIDKSIFDGNGQLLGEIYYEKPYLSKRSVGAKVINTYFDEACQNFFNGNSDFFGNDAFQNMQEVIDRAMTIHPEMLLKQPYSYFVDTEITYLSDNYVSFRQTYVWRTEGPTDIWSKGITFDLTTGSVVPLTAFVTVDSNLLKDSLRKTLLSLSLYNDKDRTRDEIEQTYKTSVEKSWVIADNYGNEFDLKTNYFFDGEYVNITLYQSHFPVHNGLIFQYNQSDIKMNNVYTYELEKHSDEGNVLTKRLYE